jgi:hypothetical protein
MFRNTFQKGFLSVFYAIGSKPLLVWDAKVSNGFIKRITDEDSKSLALDMRGLNVATCFITAPSAPCKSLGIHLPYLTIIVKNLQKYFSFEVQILDDRNQLRRYRLSNFQKQTRSTSFSTSMPLALNYGWNQIQLNLADFTRRTYDTNYMECVRITIHANCRLRNVYFTDRWYNDEEKPVAYKFIAKEDKKPLHNKTALKSKAPLESLRPTSPITTDARKTENTIKSVGSNVFKQASQTSLYNIVSADKKDSSDKMSVHFDMESNDDEKGLEKQSSRINLVPSEVSAKASILSTRSKINENNANETKASVHAVKAKNEPVNAKFSINHPRSTTAPSNFADLQINTNQRISIETSVRISRMDENGEQEELN